MNKEVLKGKYNQVQNNEYLMIDDKIDFEMFVGKKNDKHCFVIRGITSKNIFKSTSKIKLELYELDNGVKQLFYILDDETMYEIFIDLIIDIYNFLLTKNNRIIESSYNRWLMWRKLFSNATNLKLTNEKITGLIGELVFLDRFLFNRYSINDSIKSWGGADYSKKDFYINDEWFEVKSTINEGGYVTIHSLEQLDSEVEGKLVAVIFEITTIVDNNGININGIVNHLIEKINDDDLINVFIKKLSNQGYVYNSEYNNLNVKLKKMKFYIVNKQFPKLTHNNIDNAIAKCNYDLDLNILEKYKEEEIIYG